MQALLSGNIQLMFETVPAACPLIKAGRVKALGVASSTPHGSGAWRASPGRR
jgi:tripartite-type tricarboxylate transporter receptor subunit TctC